MFTYKHSISIIILLLAVPCNKFKVKIEWGVRKKKSGVSLAIPLLYTSKILIKAVPKFPMSK